jgi:hypothetical protein
MSKDKNKKRSLVKKSKKKKSYSTRVNLLILQSWAQDQDNTIKKRRKQMQEY